jgi:hypothetical protein
LVEKKLDFKHLKGKITTVEDLTSFEHFFFVLNTRLLRSSNEDINTNEILSRLPDNLDINGVNQRFNVMQAGKIETTIYINTQKKALNLLRIKSSIHVSSMYDSHLKKLAYNDIKAAPKRKLIFLS